MPESSIHKSPLSLQPILIILYLMLALGCVKAAPEIIGSWDNVKAPEIVEFKPDGSGVFTYPNSRNPPLAFSWRQALKNSYIMDVNFMGNRKTLTATIHDKSLSIESTMGKEFYQKHISR